MRTLASYREMDKDFIQTGFIDWLLEDNGLLARLHIKEVKGNGIKYNVRTARGAAAWTQPNETIVTTSGTTSQRSAAIYALTKQADVDKFAQATNSTQDPTIAELKESADDMMFEWSERMVHGRTTTSSAANHPKGLFQLIAELESEATTDLDSGNNSQVVVAHATSEAITIDDMSELRDALKLPLSCYVMNKRMRRKLESLARAAGNNLEHDKDELGYPVQMFGGAPIYIVDAIESSYPNGSSSVLDLTSYAIGTTRAADNDNSAIFALNTSEQGFCILQSGALKREGPWTPDDKDADRYRFTWYTGFGLLNKFGAAVLVNGLDTAL